MDLIVCRWCSARRVEHPEFQSCVSCMKGGLGYADVLLGTLRRRVGPLGWSVAVVLDLEAWCTGALASACLDRLPCDCAQAALYRSVASMITGQKNAFAFAFELTRPSIVGDKEEDEMLVTLIERRALLASSGSRRASLFSSVVDTPSRAAINRPKRLRSDG